MSSVPKQVSNTLQSLITLTEAGIIRLQRPDRALRTARQPDPLGRHARRRLRGVGRPLSRRGRAHRRARPAHVPGDPGAHERARPRARRRRRQRGRQRRDHGPQPPRLRRVGGRLLEARGARAVPQHVVLRPAARRRRRPREAEGDHLRRGVRRGARRRRAPAQALHRLGRAGGRDEGPDARGADRARRPANVVPPAEPGKAIILTSGTTGTPKGASRSQPKSLDPVAALLVAHPAEGAREDDDRRAAVPRLGLRALHARHGPVLDDRAQAQVRRGGDAVADRPARLHGARGRAGDAAAHPRARRRGARPLRPLARQGGPGLRLRAARRA